MNPIENLKTFPSKSYTNVTGRERILFVDPKDAKKGTTPPVNYMELQTLASLVNSGSVQFENIDYTTLYNKSVNGELVPGQWYRLTDYKSVNFLNGYRIALSPPSPAPNFNPREIYQGDEEILLLQAISEYDISPIGYSETYPGDIVQYLPFTNTIGLPLYMYNGYILPDLSTVSGFDLQWDGTNVYFEMPTGYSALFGYTLYIYASFSGVNSIADSHILLTPSSSYPTYASSNVTSRIKVENNGTKIILLDFVEQDYLDYDPNTLYVESAYEIDKAFGWITKRIDTNRNITVPFDFRARKYRRFKCEVFGLITDISYSATGNTATDGTYIVNSYASTTVQGNAATFKVVVSGGAVTSVRIYNPGKLFDTGETITIDGISIGGSSGTDDINIVINNVYSSTGPWGQGHYFNGATTTGEYDDFKSFDNGLGPVYNITWNDFGGPVLGANNDNVVIFSDFTNTTINSGCYDNTLSSCEDNFIDSDFNGNTITGDFYYNQIGKSFADNTLGSNFYSNTVESNFSTNTMLNIINGNYIGNSFSSNIVKDWFVNNVIGNYFSNNIIENNFAYNHIQNNFYYNKIKEGFGFGYSTSQGNMIGNYFSYNDIGEYFYNNTIADGFHGNTIGDYFQLNAVKIALSSTNFVSSGATHVYGYYNCDIFRRSDNTLQLSYIDNTNTVQYTVTTA